MLTFAEFLAKTMDPMVISAVQSGLLDDAIFGPELTGTLGPDIQKVVEDRIALVLGGEE